MKLSVPFFLGKSNTKIKQKNKKINKSNSNSPPPPLLHSQSNTFTSSSSSPSPSNYSVNLGQDCKLNVSELKLVLGRLGSGGNDDVAAVLAEANSDSDGRINLEDFLQPEIYSEEEELREVFRVYDVNGDGKISAEELRDVFLTIGDTSCSVDDCQRMIGVVDSDGDGFVCFRDFTRMMLTNKV